MSEMDLKIGVGNCAAAYMKALHHTVFLEYRRFLDFVYVGLRTDGRMDGAREAEAWN